MDDLSMTELTEAVSDSETDCSTVTVCDLSDGSSQQIIQKKNTTLQVWRYFGFVSDSNGQPKNNDAPMCKLCFSCVTAKWGNTSNLLSHLHKHHHIEYNNVSVKPKKSRRKCKQAKLVS